jgi:peptidoglycan/LPS O-acetylase OafA/YrhL
MVPVYRSDIDGLRAIAVLSILFFHLDFEVFQGGFVGVDIFFVISGYLITSIVLRQIQSGEFSLIRFYERRMRRILPALFVVVVCTLAAGLLLFNPDLLIELAESAVATAVFFSNVLFYLEDGYFSRASELKPLLHTWSLGVEEQFYILFPGLMLIVSRYGGKNFNLWITLLFLVSLSLSIYMVGANETGAFYLIFSRAWELLTGSILALQIIPLIKSAWWRNVLSITGILLMAWGIFIFDEDTDFPGSAALLPVLGAGLVIYSGNSGAHYIRRLLGIRPLAAIGLISYSIYLWHWPLIVFVKYYNIVELTITLKLVLLFVTLSISTISWKFVETPFRTGAWFGSARNLYRFSLGGSLFLVGAGLVIVISTGFPGRYGYDKSPFYVSEDADWEYSGSCERVYQRLGQGQDLCDIGSRDKPPEFLLWGDSFARSIYTAVDDSAKRFGISGRIATERACPPLLGIERRARLTCRRFNTSVLDYLANSPTISTVIITAKWNWLLNVKLVDLDTGKRRGPPLEFIETGILRTYNELRKLGMRLVIVNSVPIVGYDVPMVHYIAHITGRNTNDIIAPTLEQHVDDNLELASIFSDINSKENVMLIDPALLLCRSKHCKVELENGLLYRDKSHLSTFGSRHISPLIDRVFEDL